MRGLTFFEQARLWLVNQVREVVNVVAIASVDERLSIVETHVVFVDVVLSPFAL